jgi:hypothetical protein
MSTQREQFVGVGLDHPRRVAELGDLAGEGPAELLPGKHPLQLALVRLGQLGAALVQEDDVDGLLVTWRGAQRDAAAVVVPGRLEPGHRQRLGLQVHHVDGAGVERALHGPLECPRRPRHVP